MCETAQTRPRGGGRRFPGNRLNAQSSQESPVGFFDSHAIGLHALAADGTILWANRTDYEHLDYTADEYIGKNIAEFHVDPKVCRDVLDRLQRGEQLTDYPIRLKCRNGCVHRMALTARAKVDSNGQFLHHQCFVRDVTEQLRRDDALRAQAHRLRTLVDGISAHALLLLDSKGEILTWNQGAESVFGYASSFIVGRHISALYPPELGIDAAASDLLSAETLGRRQDAILRLRQDGHRVQVERVLEPIFDGRGQLKGFTELSYSASQRKTASKQATDVSPQASVEELREALHLRDTFLSVASHELKTPLTPIAMRLQMLSRLTAGQADSPYVREVRKQLEGAQRQVVKLTDLINDLLDVSRIGGGRFRMELERVDFATLVREVATRHEEHAERCGSQLLIETPEALFTETSPARLEQVVTNLLDNALKYGAGQRVEVRLTEASGRIRLAVRDHGIGIAPEYHSRIFERFERAVSDRHYGGLGLGLYITRTIVEALEGSIQVQSTPGQGATFTVELPLRGASEELRLQPEELRASLASFFKISPDEATGLIDRVRSGSDWEPGPAEGTALMRVRAGSELGALGAFLVRVQVGATYPFHQHEDHDERLFIFQGGLAEPDGSELWPGQTVFNSRGTGHWSRGIREDCYLAALQLPPSSRE